MECHYTCFTNAEATGIEDNSFHLGGLDLLQLQTQDVAVEEVQFQLYLKEIQRINPTLEEGNLFVDGLYELVCSKLPHSQSSPLKSSVSDLLTVHSSKTLLLHKYWKRPDDPAEHSAYLAIGSSFVQYVLSTYGPRGVSQFLQKLDCTLIDPQTENFTFKSKDITSLEFKWTKFAEAHVNEEFRLSTLGMLKLLFRKYLLMYWFYLALVVIIMLMDAGTTLGLAISTGRMITLGQLLNGSSPSKGNSALGNTNSTNASANRSSLEGSSVVNGSSKEMVLFPLLQWAGIAIGFTLSHFLLVIASTGLQAHVAVCVCKRLRRQLSTRLHHVTPKFLTDHSSSTIISTFIQDVNVIEKLIASSLRTVLFGILMLLTFVAYTLALIWQLALPLCILYISGQVLVWIITTKLSEHSFAKSQATGKLCNILKEEIDGYHINRLYGLARFWRSQFNNVLHKQFSKKARRSLFLEKFTLLFQVTVPQVISSLLTFSFILLLRYNFVSFENGLSIVLFFSYVVVHVVAAAGDFPTLQNATLALQRINTMLYNNEHSLPNKIYEQKEQQYKQNQTTQSNRTIVPDCLSIEFRDVCFSYIATASHWNLFDVNLKISAGERVAVLGKSGSGKSSLLNMVLQVYEPTHGEVIFGDESMDFNGLKVAATFQFNHIFNMSIRENIRIGNLQASDEEVEEAARLADLHVWISGLSRGYDTAVSSGGSSLSGGQKQRIAIARMLVARAPILVLDEVTSALDPATETKVFNKLLEITAGKTVIAATHRLEQAKEFDRIIVLSHGKVKEDGTHDELMALKGAYWCMWNNTDGVSPGKGIPIIRRRGSLTSCTPNPLPVPLIQGTPAIPVVSSAPFLTSPMFTPLCTLMEGDEPSRIMSMSQSHMTSLNTTIHQNSHSNLQDMDFNEYPIPRTSSTPAGRVKIGLSKGNFSSSSVDGSKSCVSQQATIDSRDSLQIGMPISPNVINQSSRTSEKCCSQQVNTERSLQGISEQSVQVTVERTKSHNSQPSVIDTNKVVIIEDRTTDISCGSDTNSEIWDSGPTYYKV